MSSIDGTRMVRFRVHFSELEMFYFVSENNTPIADEKQCMKLTVVLCDSIRKNASK